MRRKTQNRVFCCQWLLLLATTLSSSVWGESEQERNAERVPTEALIEGIKSSDGRWFEVELIVFERMDSDELREKFDQPMQNLTKKRQWDLLETILKPDLSNWLQGLPTCLAKLDPMRHDGPSSDMAPNAFWQAFQRYQMVLQRDWQFDPSLCLTAQESLPEFWRWYLEIKEDSLQLNQNIQWQHMLTRPTGPDHDDYHSVYLLAPQNLQLLEQFQQLQLNTRTRPLLHIGWRQPGLSKRRAKPMYLRAGQNFTEQFRYDGSPILASDREPQPEAAQPPVVLEHKTDAGRRLFNGASPREVLVQSQSDQVAQFMQKLKNGAVVDVKSGRLLQPDQNRFPQETWELDGYVTVHLNHYLFLDAEFNFRQKQVKHLNPGDYLDQLDTWLDTDEPLPSTTLEGELEDAVVISAMAEETEFGEEETVDTDVPSSHLVPLEVLQNYPFKQTRRTYSGDLHYLDHPKLGVLFQIRKYRH